MKKISKILAIVAVVALCLSITAISCFAYDNGTILTFKDTYTEAELQAYLTEYKDVDGVYYAGDATGNGVFPNALSLEESFVEAVMLYRGSNFSGSNFESTWMAVVKTETDYRLYFHLSDEANEIYNFKTSTGVWASAGKPEPLMVDGTFTLTDAQFKATGLLWSVPGGSASGSVGASGNTIADFLSSIGSGLKSFLPNVAEAGVDTVDILFVTPEGALTTVAVLTIIGVVSACGLGVFAMIKKKIKKI